MKNKVNRIIRVFALALVFACLLSSFASAADVSGFSDVPDGAWYRSELEYAVENGVIYGTSDTTFSPQATLSRGQFVTILGRAVGTTGAAGSKFADVDENVYYAPYVYWASINGIVYGTSDTAFSPNAPITRQDMATMLGRLLNVCGYTLPDSETAISAFADGNKVADYAKESVETLRKAGILKGDDAGCVNPDAKVTRAEGMAVLVRVKKTMEEVKVSSSGANNSDKSIVKPYAEELAKVADEMNSRYGMVGRLIIPDVGINVALFDTELGIDAQVLVNRVDSACMFPAGIWGDEALIGDHNYQGFDGIKSAVANKTIAYINDGSTFTGYVCTFVGKGYRTDDGLYNKNWGSIFNDNSGGLCMYTCNGSSGSITYTFWQPISG